MCGVRPCREEDIPGVVGLSELWASERITHGQVAAPESFFRSRLGDYFWIAEADSEVIGFIYGSVHVSDGLAVIPAGGSYLE